MTAKEFLRRAREVDRRVDEAHERAERLRAKLESGRMSSVTGMPRGGGADWTETADKLIELERVVNQRTRELVRWKLARGEAHGAGSAVGVPAARAGAAVREGAGGEVE